MVEQSPLDIIEAEILEINKRLSAIVLGREAQPRHPLDNVSYITPEDKSFLQKATAPAFWKHYLGSTVVLACGEIDWARHKSTSIDSDKVDMLQNKSIELLRFWKENPDRKSDKLEEASIDVCLQVFDAFNWKDNPDLVLQLKAEVCGLGDCFMRLNGVNPL